ncbi:MAG: winged helix-turn-helix transcriptional regulator [Lachnospiraceae bacterium]|nr:winged helix-turn-helix transcriptional regulator [Lachnospiraceae bacterium]
MHLWIFRHSICKVFLKLHHLVEYSLSEVGKSMMPILHSFCKWGIEHMPNDWEM